MKQSQPEPGLRGSPMQWKSKSTRIPRKCMHRRWKPKESLRFSKMNLTRFPELRKRWNLTLQEAERCGDETYKDWTKKTKTLRLDCLLVKNWPPGTAIVYKIIYDIKVMDGCSDGTLYITTWSEML